MFIYFSCLFSSSVLVANNFTGFIRFSLFFSMENNRVRIFAIFFIRRQDTLSFLFLLTFLRQRDMDKILFVSISRMNKRLMFCLSSYLYSDCSKRLFHISDNSAVLVDELSL